MNELLRATIKFSQAGAVQAIISVDEDEVKKAINNHDPDLARKILNKNAKGLLAILLHTNFGGGYTVPECAKAALQLILKGGASKEFSVDIEKNWRLDVASGGYQISNFQGTWSSYLKSHPRPYALDV